MSRAALAKFITLTDEQLKEVVVWTHKGEDAEGHKQLIPQEVDLIQWTDQPEMEGPWDPSDTESVFELNVEGVPLDHTHFTLRFEHEPILTDTLYGTSERRFYMLVVNTGSQRGVYEPDKESHPGPGAHYG